MDLLKNNRISLITSPCDVNICLPEVINVSEHCSLSYNFSSQFNILNTEVSENDSIIIEFPEAGLHPKNIVKFSEYIVNKAVNGKTFVIVSYSALFIQGIKSYSIRNRLFEKTKFYFFEKSDKKGGFCLIDKTDNTNDIFKDLARPYDDLFKL